MKNGELRAVVCSTSLEPGIDWQLRELPAISPFSFPIYASVIKESMMLEDPAAALERIYHEMFAQVEEDRRPNRSAVGFGQVKEAARPFRERPE